MLSFSFRFDQIFNNCYLNMIMTSKFDLDVQQSGLLVRFVEQKLTLSSSCRCDQIHNKTNPSINMATLVVPLKSDRLTTSRPMRQRPVLNKRSCLAAAVGVTKFIITTSINILSLT
jgi:hypothetical protein